MMSYLEKNLSYNTTNNLSSCDLPTELVGVSATMLILATVLGTLSNIFIIGVFIWERSLRTPVHSLMFTLAIVDFIHCAVHTTSLLLRILGSSWITPDVHTSICKVAFTCSTFTNMENVLLIGALSIARYTQVSKHHQIHFKSVLLYIAFTVILEICFVTYTVFYPVLMTGVCTCSEQDRDYSLHNNWVPIIFLCMFTVCGIIMLVYYLKLLQLIKLHRSAIASLIIHTNKLDRSVFRSMRLLTINFIITYLPLAILIPILISGPLSQTVYENWVLYGGFALNSLGHAVDPLIYGLYSSHFRKAFKKCCLPLWRKCTILGKHNQVSTINMASSVADISFPLGNQVQS
ncbi:melanocortin receptor 5-like [Lingula anatina]|uniref:Melanocortin receptor 5-like n=1 Tax=Lingula anatina TaxID=7574 RepID=A0A1S3I5G5_LINAN|nr:melanocortin receptor 5-like [Lingula anatina]XP_013392679.1 melanocortin receptor 5-like [Lingula anatina]|eukprot:XP_013392604.1 melanocortin receptor 5-like [Lingula anatina]